MERRGGKTRYSLRAGPLNVFGPRRVRAPAVPFDELPPISTVLLSHTRARPARSRRRAADDVYPSCDAEPRARAPRDVGSTARAARARVPRVRRADDLRHEPDRRRERAPSRAVGLLRLRQMPKLFRVSPALAENAALRPLTVRILSLAAQARLATNREFTILRSRPRRL